MYRHDEHTSKVLWELISRGDREHLVMCTSTFSAYNEDKTTEEFDRSGLVDGHAYSLLNVKII
jgi:hypothetical protein